jgi:hypothetical protein
MIEVDSCGHGAAEQEESLGKADSCGHGIDRELMAEETFLSLP